MIGFDDYKVIQSYSYSKLKAFLKSPLHGLTQKPFAETAAMRFGTATELIFKGQLEKIVVNPHEDGRTKAAKDFKLENAKRLVLTQSEMDRALNCVSCLHAHPAVKSLHLQFFNPDFPLQGTLAGLPLKGLSDWYFDGAIVDLKTTQSIDPGDFARTVDNFHYDLQAAVYCELARQNGVENPSFYWITVESEYPHDVAVYKACERVIEVGNAKLRRALHNVKLANDGAFLGISDAITTLAMPPWYGRKFEDPYCLPE